MMLQQLDTSQYAKLHPALAEMEHHLILESILAGNTVGTVYVDDVNYPKAALCRYKDRFYLTGEARPDVSQSLKSLFHDTIFPQGETQGRDVFVLYYARGEWQAAIDATFDGRRSWQGERGYYRLRREQLRSQPALPDEITIHQIDEKLLAQKHLNYLDELIEEIQSERDSVAAFLQHSFGFCAVAGNDIAGLCTSEFNIGARCEVGIMTMEAYQRRGVATALAHTLAEYAFAEGITSIGWHCWARNTPSVATALKVGYEHVRHYPAIVGWYQPE